MSGRPFVHGYDMYLEKATLAYSSAGIPLTVYTNDGKSQQPTLEGGGEATAAFTQEIQAAVDSITTGKPSPLLSGQLARDALVMCHREIESVKTGQQVGV